MPADEDVHEARHVAAASAKARGSKAYGEGDYALAARCFGEAIAVATNDDPDVHIYRSNRCAARLQLGDVAGATEDATECTRLAPKWPKGWSRLGNCLSRQPNRAGEAERALKNAIRLGSRDAAAALAELRATGGDASSSTASTSTFSRFRARVGSLFTVPRNIGAMHWRDAATSARVLFESLDDKTRWILKAVACLVAFFVGRAVFGGPELPFGLGRRGRRGSYVGSGRGAYADDGAYDDRSESYAYSNGTLGGLGTVVGLAVVYCAYKQGASPYTLMMLANVLGLTGGGRRRGYGGFGGMPYGMGGGMGGMRGRRGGFF
jgi:tetratricopeptide (TPR) repeat protein